MHLNGPRCAATVWQSLRVVTAASILVATLSQAGAQATRQIVSPQASPEVPKATSRSVAGNPAPATASSSQAAQWRPISGVATAVGANARGDLWVISNVQRLGPRAFRLQSGEWRDANESGARIAVDPSGNAWVVQSNGSIFRYTGAQWEAVPGSAMDIAVGANGAVWIIGSDQSIARAQITTPAPVKPATQTRTKSPQTPARVASTPQYQWQKVPGAGVRIAVDPQGNPWVVNSAGQVFHYTASGWIQFPVAARGVAVGPDGVVYLVGTTQASDGFGILRSQGQNWVNDGVDGEEIAAGAAGVAYVVKVSGNTLAERVPNTLTAGVPPVLPTPAAQPVQQAGPGGLGGAAASPSNGVRGIAGAQPQPAAPSPGAPSPAAGSGTSASGTASNTSASSAASGTSGSSPAAATSGSSSSSAANAPVAIPLSVATVQVTPAPTTVAVPSSAVTVPVGNLTLNQPGAIPLSSLTSSGNSSANKGSGGSAILGATAPAPSGPTNNTSGSLVLSGSMATPSTQPLNPAQPLTPSAPAAPLQVTGLGYVPIKAPSGSTVLIPGDPYVYSQGKLLCSDPEVTGVCGNVDAGFVGGYTLNTVCSNGFYDMTDGGTCWQCPAADSNGSWLRSGDAVNSGTACWRDATGPAHWDSYGLAWNCSSGQFWDSQDQNHNINGSCWDCPGITYNGTSYSTIRSADPVQSNTACWVKETTPAVMLAYNGCPTPNAKTMYPNDMRRPGESFLDIASGISVANDAGGACWACPVTDEKGNYLYTERNANTLIGLKTGNGGCMLEFKYTPGVFVEPGLSGLPGVADVLAQEQVFQRPSALTTFLYGVATAKNFSGATADTWVAAQWKDIAAHPYQNAQIKALMYEYVTSGAPSYMYASGVIGTGTTAEQAAQTKLVTSFQEYIRARRTYIAQEALDMYYAWKNNVGVERSLHAESELVTLFYYGTVPLDFQSIVAEGLVPSVTGTAVLSSVVGAENYASIAQAQNYTWFNAPKVNGTSVARQFRVSNLLRDMFKPSAVEAPEPEINIDPDFAFQPSDLGAEGGALAGETAGETGGEAAAEGMAALLAQINLASGPAGIILAGAAMAAMAIQQVVEIANAEPNLISAKNSAMNTVNLGALLQQTSGPDQVAEYWSDATGITNEPGDPNINAAAANGYTGAQQTHFAQISPSGATSTAASAAAPATNAASPNKTTTPVKNPLHKN